MEIAHDQMAYQFQGLHMFFLRTLQGRLLESHQNLAYFKESNGLVRGTLDDMLKRLCENPPWQIYRLQKGVTILSTSTGTVLLSAGTRESEVSFCAQVWAVDQAAGEALYEAVQSRIGQGVFQGDPELSVSWLVEEDQTVETYTVTERISERLQPEAYPWLPQPLAAFTQSFLASKEPVSVFFGAPGVGKTRLIRHLLAALGQKSEFALDILYVTDTKLATSDSLFRRFLTGSYDAMVIEDADHLLRPRSDGNDSLHRFLAASDGFIQPGNKRLLFSTNLPSRLDIDEALLRPGRCFGCFEGARLSREQAAALLASICSSPDVIAAAWAEPELTNAKTVSLAEVYAAVHRVTALLNGPQFQTPPRHLEARAA